MRVLSTPRHVPFMVLGMLAAAFFLPGCSMGDSSGGGKSPDIPLDRKAGPVRLGMTVMELEAATEVTEQTERNPGLIEGERSFELKRTAVPEGVRSIGLRFLNDRLYRITLDYIPDHYDDDSWAALLEENTRRYGKGWLQKMRMAKYPTELISWEDENTRLV
ncbi:MAG TPA: hypothetical protein VIU33_03100, partial [Nitrospiria bacterium]